MRRREFCGAGLAAGFFATYPFLAARADTSIAAVNLDGAGIELEKAAVNELAESLSGRLILSGHPEYDTVRKVWNGMHDKRPALIARCSNAADVQQAVTFARERDLLVAVRNFAELSHFLHDKLPRIACAQAEVVQQQTLFSCRLVEAGAITLLAIKDQSGTGFQQGLPARIA